MTEGHLAIGLKLKKNPMAWVTHPSHECLMTLTYVCHRKSWNYAWEHYFYANKMDEAVAIYLIV